MKLDVETKYRILECFRTVKHKDAICTARAYNAKYEHYWQDSKVHYHDVSDYLDELLRKGLLEYDPNKRGFDGWKVYRYATGGKKKK